MTDNKGDDKIRAVQERMDSVFKMIPDMSKANLLTMRGVLTNLLRDYKDNPLIAPVMEAIIHAMNKENEKRNLEAKKENDDG